MNIYTQLYIYADVYIMYTAEINYDEPLLIISGKCQTNSLKRYINISFVYMLPGTYLI